MKQVTIALVIFTTNTYAQSVNLAHDPNKPVLTQPKTNAQALKGSRPASPTTDTTDLAKKFNTPGSSTSTSTNSYMNTNPQPMNSQSQQMNIGGGTKATSTIYYDNSGKMQGSGTSIEFGKKKK